jgi:hypothetical protein
MPLIRVRRRVRLLEWVPEEGAGATGGLPPGIVQRPLARFVQMRRLRAGQARFAGLGGLGGGEGGGTPPEPPPSSKRRRHRWFPGLARRYR